jgi:G3E family GTPase
LYCQLGEEVTEEDEFGIRSFVYKARRPFHPQRFSRFLLNATQKAIRAKGYFWLASRPSAVGLYQLAGTSQPITGAGYWYAAIGKDQWPEDELELSEIQSHWDPTYGDRRQELVFIGIDLDQSGIVRMLNEVLLTDPALVPGPRAWQSFPDPLPKFQNLKEGLLGHGPTRRVTQESELYP